MLFDFGMIGSYLFMSILLYLIYRVSFRDPSRASSVAEAQVLRYHDTLRYFYPLSALIISARIIYLFSFPTELTIYKIKFSFSALFLLWFVLQIVIINIYLFYLILTGFYFRLKPQVKSNFLLHIFNQITYYFYFDILVLLTFYFYFSYHQLLPHIVNTGNNTAIEGGVPYYVHMLLFVTFIIFLFFYINFKRQRKPLYLRMYGIFFVFTLLLCIYLSGYRLDAYYQIFYISDSDFSVFSLKNGFIGWFWVTYIMLCILSHLLIYKVIKLKNDFINVQFYMNMLIHGIRFNFVCILGLVFITIIPDLLRLIYK